MIGFDEALGLMGAAATPLGQDTVALEAAARRILAKPISAQIDSPRGDVSAMDGYAARLDSVRQGQPWRVIGESRPGHGFTGTVGDDDAVRIFTVMPQPAGADAVVGGEGRDVQGGMWEARHRGRPTWPINPHRNPQSAATCCLPAD